MTFLSFSFRLYDNNKRANELCAQQKGAARFRPVTYDDKCCFFFVHQHDVWPALYMLCIGQKILH